MADESKAKTGLLSRIRLWVKESIAESVPPELAACEFRCRKHECTLGEWETCENRLRGMDSGKP